MARFTASATAALAGVLLAGTAATDHARADDHGDEQKMVCQQKTFEKGLKYQQQSAEMDSLQRQAYTLAKIRLKEELDKHGGPEGLAVVTDVDETVFDNTPLLVRDMNACRAYQAWDTWGHWEREGDPELIPGAMDFLTYADDKGLDIFYISNRFDKNKSHTIETMKEKNLPQVSKDTVMLYDLSKKERRAKVREDHKIVLLLGDSLHDFHHVFGDASMDKRREKAAEHAQKFGDKWIMFPNATYGDWTEAELETWDAPIEVDE